MMLRSDISVSHLLSDLLSRLRLLFDGLNVHHIHIVVNQKSELHEHKFDRPTHSGVNKKKARALMSSVGLGLDRWLADLNQRFQL